ncbi:hypothetical protein V5F53_07915 [Xanthobacter sp. V4C-4]|uniref:COG4315 family predicted lipoprotein n=1 Tax=Xanthobacter cornucopiae TaxID=3119924 RepID=UPI0037284E7A
MRPSLLRPAAAALLLALGTLSAVADPASVAETAKGKALVNPAGMTLYVFAKDEPGKSACTGPCATNWPPLKAAAGAKAMGAWTLVTRDDGSSQWAYKGKPLYSWSKDQKPGDATGDGLMSGAWMVAKP